jgi:hypothetical protein
MIPSAFMFLDAFPLTPNGKVDRRALPAPDSSARGTTTEYAEPTGDLERQIATAWQEVLKIDRVGKHDNFFDLGGNSLLILQVHSRVNRLIERELPVVKLFEHPTVAALAAFIGGSSSRLGDSSDRLSARRRGPSRRSGFAGRGASTMPRRTKGRHSGPGSSPPTTSISSTRARTPILETSSARTRPRLTGNQARTSPSGRPRPAPST